MNMNIGLGTWKLEGKQAEDTVYNAIKIGYRYIDCAFEYLNEKEVGAGIRRAIEEDLVSREELFIATKLW